MSGEPAGTRTQDPRLKRALLYQLSYELISLFNLFIFNRLNAIQFSTSRGHFGVGSQFVATLYRNRPRTNQGLQRLQFMRRREMGIPGGHSDRLVSHEFLHCFQVYPSHHQPASEERAQRRRDRWRSDLSFLLDRCLIGDASCSGGSVALVSSLGVSATVGCCSFALFGSVAG